MITNHLTGTYLVRVTRSALEDAHRLFPKVRNRMILRRHALKLRFWPTRHPQDTQGQILDLDWSFIQALAGEKVGELRIHDQIGDHDNLRVIFWVAEKRAQDVLPQIWVLAAMQKKSNDFSQGNIRTFWARKKLVVERFYKS